MIKSRRNFMKGAIALGLAPIASSAKDITDTKSLKFIHVTDSHMDIADEDSIESIKTLVSFINKNYKDLDFVLFGGDNFNNNASKDSDAKLFKKIIDELHCPSYLVRGNKESSPHPKGDSINLSEFKEIFLQNNALKVVGKDWVLEKGGYNIVGLDSCIEGANNGIYSQETLNFAEDILKNGKPTVVLNHHPYSNYWGGSEKKDLHKYVLNNTEETQKRLFGYPNLILTLSGHKHIDSVTKIGSVNVVVTRGFVRPLDMDRYPMRLVELSNKKISEKLIYTE